MGEEHGEQAPFQFFSDHIDKRIATATRDGRRREFAAFLAFAGEEVPDPQALETFEASKLTGQGDDPGLRELYAALLRMRRELSWGDADDVAYDEADRWLRVQRGAFSLVCNFGSDDAVVPAPGASAVVLGTHEARIEGEGGVWLPALAGALVR
jgi:maltooligosyltrehalose trehalohydrolase